jgi:hypothetical protein
MRESDNLEMASASPASRVKKQGHWLLKERTPAEQLQSMPPIGSLKDSGIGTEEPEGFARSTPNRSSFGMALKVCKTTFLMPWRRGLVVTSPPAEF